MKTDKRFTIARVFCGYSRARWCVYFCGELINTESTSEKKARAKRRELIAAREKSLTD